MEKKYRIQIDGREMEFETEKEFKQFKKEYNEYEFMINEQFNVGIGTRKSGGGDNTIIEPEITLRDVFTVVKQQGTAINELFTIVKKQGEAINELFTIVKQQGEAINELFTIVKQQGEAINELFTIIKQQGIEMREGFKAVNTRLDAHDEIFKRNSLN